MLNENGHNDFKGAVANWAKASHAYEKIQKNYNPELELIISQSPYWSCEYALNILKTPFPLGELSIIKDYRTSFFYAKNIIKGRFKLLEQNIKNKSAFSQYIERVMEFNHE